MPSTVVNRVSGAHCVPGVIHGARALRVGDGQIAVELQIRRAAVGGCGFQACTTIGLTSRGPLAQFGLHSTALSVPLPVAPSAPHDDHTPCSPSPRCRRSCTPTVVGSCSTGWLGIPAPADQVGDGVIASSGTAVGRRAAAGAVSPRRVCSPAISTVRIAAR